MSYLHRDEVYDNRSVLFTSKIWHRFIPLGWFFHPEVFSLGDLFLLEEKIWLF
jgi:hypothetical protein